MAEKKEDIKFEKAMKRLEHIVEELEKKLPPMMASGGCVLALDHRIPNGTSLENYRFYLQKSWEILES